MAFIGSERRCRLDYQPLFGEGRPHMRERRKSSLFWTLSKVVKKKSSELKEKLSERYWIGDAKTFPITNVLTYRGEMNTSEQKNDSIISIIKKKRSPHDLDTIHNQLKWAREASEQQHSQDLRRIYRRGVRVFEFITFYQNALHLTRVHCVTLCQVALQQEQHEDVTCSDGLLSYVGNALLQSARKHTSSRSDYAQSIYKNVNLGGHIYLTQKRLYAHPLFFFIS